MEATLIKLAHDTKLVVVSGGAVDTLKGRTAIQSERPGEWANRNPVKISKDQCQVLRLGRRNPSQGHSLQLCGKGTLGLGGHQTGCVSARTPGGNEGEEHPGLRYQQRSQCIKGSDSQHLLRHI